MPTAKIFVGNIAPDSDEKELQAMFEEYGVVTECDIVSNYAFVHMESEAVAKRAIDALNNSSYNGMSIRCELSTKNTQGRKRLREEEEPVPSGRGGRGGPRGRGGDRGRGARGGGRGRGFGRSSDPYGGFDDEEPGYKRSLPGIDPKDPFRDPYIRAILLRDPYVRDLIDREMFYREAITTSDPYEDPIFPPAPLPRRDPLMPRPPPPPPQSDPFERPPPEFYHRGPAPSGSQNGGVMAAVRERLAQVAASSRPPPRPVPPPSMDERFNAYDMMGHGMM